MVSKLLAGMWMALALTGCKTLHVKIYYLDPEQGLVRKQDNEVLTWKQAEGYLCVSPADFESIVQACKQ